jgi:hypothetical protein
MSQSVPQTLTFTGTERSVQFNADGTFSIFIDYDDGAGHTGRREYVLAANGTVLTLPDGSLVKSAGIDTSSFPAVKTACAAVLTKLIAAAKAGI